MNVGLHMLQRGKGDREGEGEGERGRSRNRRAGLAGAEDGNCLLEVDVDTDSSVSHPGGTSRRGGGRGAASRSGKEGGSAMPRRAARGRSGSQDGSGGGGGPGAKASADLRGHTHGDEGSMGAARPGKKRRRSVASEGDAVRQAKRTRTSPAAPQAKAAAVHGIASDGADSSSSGNRADSECSDNEGHGEDCAGERDPASVGEQDGEQPLGAGAN